MHVAYQTSGNIAVFDHDASRFNDFVREFLKTFAKDSESSKELIAICDRVDEEIETK